ncbi:protein-glutamate O-methyltransferase CheR [Enterococcus saccharolyticus]|uniref:CheR family methyltransferase n=1 Tax=Enterococcus TaxID=1350 RepID=UPI001E3D7B12|nr:protein-glutamate O-methyltransferase CheR [Enterococcus saccharolyticus]MCD5002862.1 protein-glutamate O-methyltransferase CheR [Enterococcus saccharolyticus]
MQLNFDFFNKWVKDKLGIQLDAYKEKQMQRRIANIMESHNIKTLEAYAKLLERNADAKQEFLEHITINVTEFYRNRDLFEVFEKNLVALNKTFPRMKIWSAACSIGAEPYTLAMILQKNKINGAKIIATDIDRTILQKAKTAIYKPNELKNMPPAEKTEYFTKLSADQYQLKDNIKRQVMFKRHDLLKDRYEDKCHVIVCRNVTIYFKNEARDEVYRKFADALVPGGILFTGATETINFSEKFGLKKIDSFIYQKM